MIARRVIVLSMVALLGLAVETTMLGRVTLYGTKPDLLLVFVVAIAMIAGPAAGSTAGFALGLATDLVLEAPRGLTALTYTLVGYVVGRVRARVQTPSAWLPIAMVAVATAAAVLFYAGMTAMLGQRTASLPLILRRAVFSAAYNALLTPFVFPLTRALVQVTRPRSEVLR